MDQQPRTPPTRPAADHRRVRVLEGDPETVRARAREQAPEGPDCPWIGGDRPPAPAARLLGRDLAGAVIDTFDGIDANAFGAVAGALRAGATLWWLMPDRDLPDRSPFARRCDALVHSAATTAAPAPGSRPAVDDPDCVTADQMRAVTAVQRCIRGRARRPVVLVANRGRGKSAALGIAAARALAEVPGTILVTGPDPDAADTVLTHGRAQALALGEDPDRIRFVAVDRVPDADDSVRALLVDEAAALPVARLGHWLRRFGRVALATTVHGYEGTGRGFELRLRGLLDRLAPDWRRVELAEPVRFAAGDPLEALQFALLALDADPVAPDPQAPPVAEPIPAATLAADETALRALFGLLVSAHYQTRPSDLVRMLDDPAMRVWHLGPARAPLACALCIDEGGLDAGLAADLVAGTRQPPGQQGPGVLARRLGLEAGARMRSVRISRITVHPQVRRRGLGRQLVDAVAEDARRRGAGLLTSNFGATPDLIAFWHRAGALPVRLGLTREAASGEHSAFVLRALDAEGEALQARARAEFAAEFPDQLADALDGIEPPLVRALLTSADAPAQPSTTDRERTRRWARGELPLEACPGALRRALLARLCGAQAQPDPELDALVMRVLQQRGWDEVAAALGVDGRAAAEARLRRAFEPGIVRG